MSLEVRRRASFVIGDSAVEGNSQTNHVDSTYQDIASGSIATDNTGEQKKIYASGVNSTGVKRITGVLPFQVTRRSADTPDFKVVGGLANWENEEDLDVQFRVVADGDNGWIAQVKDQGGNIGTLDWTFTIETKQSFAL